MKSKTSMIKGLLALMLSFSAFAGYSAKLSPPKPTVSKGTYSSYVKVTWSKVKNCSGYYVFRGTSKTWESASLLKKIKGAGTVKLLDSSATAGKKYYYWICPYKGSTYYYNRSRYAYGYRKVSESVKLGKSSVQAGKRVYIYYKKGNSYAVPGSMKYSVSSSGVATIYKYKSLSGSACGYIETRKAGTVTVYCGNVSAKLKVTGASNAESSYSLSIVCSKSVKVGGTVALWCQRNDGFGVTPVWTVSDGNIAGLTTPIYGGSATLVGKKAGTVTLTATYDGKRVSTTITVVSSGSIGGGGSSAGGTYISGSSSLRYGSSSTYYLYVNGKKITSNSVAWSRSGLATMQDKGSYGLLKATSKPVGSYNSITVYAKYNGKRYSKTVKITK